MREVEKIKAQEELIRDMIREAGGEPKVKLRPPRSNVKQTILDLLEQAGPAGLNAATAVETSAKAGVTPERGTVRAFCPVSRMRASSTTMAQSTGSPNTRGTQARTCAPF